jgi:uncharacterized protein
MPVVSNTSPILGLAAIGHLDLLRKQFGQVLIPEAVVSELQVGTKKRGTEVIRLVMKQGWLQERRIENTNLARALALELDQGESEAIALALEVNSDHILMDEHDGRSKARAMGLHPVGVLGVLMRAQREGDILSMDTTLKTLREDAGFFIGDELVQRILSQTKEKK